jgi:hypothetical protein
MIARRGIERAELAAKLQSSTSTVTNLYRRETPDGVSDVFLSRLADLLEMSEPDLMVKWKDGLPGRGASTPTKSAKKANRK